MKLIPVCSGKGGEGKSCVCAYTAAAMAGLAKKTLLIDMGISPGSPEVILGAQDSVVFNLGDVLTGECEPQKAMIPIEGRENLFLLPAGKEAFAKPGLKNFAEIIDSLKDGYDYIFIDNPDFEIINPNSADTILLVTTPDTLSVRAAEYKHLGLYDAGTLNVRLVINNVPPRIPPMKSFKNFDGIINTVGSQLIAVIPSSQKLHYSANNGLPLSRDSLTVKVFESLALRLTGKQLPLLIR